MAHKAVALKEEGNRSDAIASKPSLALIIVRYFNDGNFQEAESLYSQAYDTLLYNTVYERITDEWIESRKTLQIQ